MPAKIGGKPNKRKRKLNKHISDKNQQSPRSVFYPNRGHRPSSPSVVQCPQPFPSSTAHCDHCIQKASTSHFSSPCNSKYVAHISQRFNVSPNPLKFYDLNWKSVYGTEKPQDAQQVNVSIKSGDRLTVITQEEEERVLEVVNHFIERCTSLTHDKNWPLYRMSFASYLPLVSRDSYLRINDLLKANYASSCAVILPLKF